MFEEYLDKFDEILIKAKQSKHVRNDEMDSIYKIIEEYIVKNKLIVSNSRLLADIEENKVKSYVIYGSDIFIHANNLANEISKITIHVFLFTNIKNQDFTVMVNGINTIQFYNISKKLNSLFLPVKKNKFLIYPPEFELLEIYYKLYSPLYFKDWEELEIIKNSIEKQFIDRKKIIGGLTINKKLNFDTSIIFNWLKGKTI